MPKFKTKKKKTTNYRKITESLPQEKKVVKKEPGILEDLVEYMNLFLVFLGICLIFFVGYAYMNFEKTQDQHRRVMDNYLYWKDVVRSHPNLTDAYYNAALYSTQLGDSDGAVVFLNKALELDPDFTKAKELQKRIVK